MRRRAAARRLACLAAALLAAWAGPASAQAAAGTPDGVAPAAASSPAPDPEPARSPASAPAPPTQPDAAAPVPAPPPQRPATALPNVEVNATRASPAEERRQSTAAKIVIGREQIEQFGDSTLGDVMRRLPGVTQGGRPGRGGDVRMRGMGGGYTQILIDGQRAPAGFAIDQLDPDLVERIELFRAPTAETGTRAIAGTVNIVLREPLRLRGNDLRAGFGVERGRVSPGGSWTRNGGLGEDGTFNVTASARQGHQRTDTQTRTVFADAGNPVPVLDHSDFDVSTSVRDNLSLSGQARWPLGPGEFFSLQPFWNHGRSLLRSHATLDAVGGTTPAPYAQRRGESAFSSDAARLTAQLNRRLAAQTRVELRGSAGRYASESRSQQRQFGAGTSALYGSPLYVQDADTDVADRSGSLSGKLLHLLAEQHSLVAGWELERAARNETAQTRIDGVPQAGAFGDALRARTQRDAWYLQDEWEPGPDWSANAGLRVERIRTQGERDATSVHNRSRVVSPLGHLVWRFDAPQRDQLRLSLTQSYRAPTLQSLVSAPRLNSLYPAPGANTVSSPDTAGNPALRPERASGVDLALERYLGSGGSVSVNLFQRRIHDLIRNVRTLQSVPWANVPRWVSRPANLGDATTRGIEFDARFTLTQFAQAWPWLPWPADAPPPVNLRANLSLYDSRVEQVPGPDNHIDQQPRAVVNLGADHRLAGSAWTLGGSLAFTPGYRTQLTDLQGQTLGRKRVADAYALWQLDRNTRLRLSLANLAPRDSVSSTRFVQDTQTQTVTSTGRTDLNASLRLEMRL